MNEKHHGTLIIATIAASIVSITLSGLILLMALFSSNDDQPSTESSQLCLQLKIKNVEPGQIGLETGAYNG